jgi:hypothetical protein
MSDNTQQIWFIPRGKRTVFSATRSEITISTEKITVLQEGNTIFETTTNGVAAKASFGTVRFTKLDGEKNSMMKGPFIYLYNPAWSLLSYWVALFKIGKARALASSINEAAGGKV